VTNTTPLVVGIDVGGTFTDIIVRDERRSDFLVDKVSSTPGDLSVAVTDAFRRLRDRHGVDLGTLRLFAHGSTVATNALLELKLPKTGLIVTKGFRDVLEIGTMTRSEMFNLVLRKQAPLVPRELVFEVDERIDYRGNVLLDLTENEIDRLVELVGASEVDSCAISLLFSFRNSTHEHQLAEVLRERLPKLIVAVSSDIAPEIGEYPRTSTTVIAAAIQPLIERYIAGIERGIRREGVQCPLFVMQSSGGVLSAREASRHAHQMLLSGPAAGVLGATRMDATIDRQNLITFDMGGTSTDICLIHEGRPTLAREPEFDGRPLRASQLDIHTIGSGGGSLAWLAGGLLHVGPQSAGAVPGPAAYRRGGTLPTVTDAHVVLGRVDPDHFLGGEMRLDGNAAREAIATHVAAPLGLSLEEAALGILEIVNAQMARGVRVVSVNRGFDPRDFTLIAYGGAGPMHAFDVGELVDVNLVMIPRYPGAFSALGLVKADVKYDLVTMVGEPVANLDAGRLNKLYEPLLSRVKRRFDALGEGIVETRYVRVARLRYAWQENDVAVVMGDTPTTPASFDACIARFHEMHEFEFGYSNREDQVEVIALALEAYGALRGVERPVARSLVQAPLAGTDRREVYFRDSGWMSTPVIWRESLQAGTRTPGPVIVEEREATTVVGPGAVLEVDAFLNLVLRREGEMS